MTESLKALMNGLIDYAGLFPPARLPLAEALANYQSYQTTADAWMLGRFILPATRLGELPDGESLVCSALGRGGEDFLVGLHDDLAAISACRQRNARCATRVDVLETRLPSAVLREPAALRTLLHEMAVMTNSLGLTVFLEAPVLEGPAFAALLGAIGSAPFAPAAGYKMRTGGLEASAFPTYEQVALALHATAFAGVPFKATAGLHHPLPRFDDTVQARMHGFINVFVAGVLARLGIGEATLRQLLADDAASSFFFGADELGWRTHRVDLQTVVRIRRAGMVSFGCCSFDEPREDLRALAWLA